MATQSASIARSSRRLRWTVGPLLLLTVTWLWASGWLYSRMETKDWLPIVLSGFGVIVALLVAIWTLIEQRRQLTLNFAIKLWEVWSEPSMVAARNSAWQALRDEPFRNGSKHIGRLREDCPEQYTSIARVHHFFADLHDFLNAGMLDLQEAKALFRDTLQAYYCHLPFVDISDAFPAGDGTGDSHQLWFREKVLGLAKQIALEKREDFQRYQHVFDNNTKAAQDSRASFTKAKRTT